MDVKISLGNSKIGRIMNINLPPIISCPTGVPCALDRCYALKAYRRYPNVRLAWDSNLSFYKNNPIEFFNNIKIQLEKKKKIKRFRWHSSGDIVD